MRRLLLFSLLALTGCTLALSLGGCARPPVAQVRSIKIEADPDANRTSATAVDIVFVYDTTAVAMMPSNGPEWFAHKAALQADLPTVMDVVSVQRPGGSTAKVELPAMSTHAIAVFAYADYASPTGQPRLVLTHQRDVILHLQAETITLR